MSEGTQVLTTWTLIRLQYVCVFNSEAQRSKKKKKKREPPACYWHETSRLPVPEFGDVSGVAKTRAAGWWLWQMSLLPFFFFYYYYFLSHFTPPKKKPATSVMDQPIDRYWCSDTMGNYWGWTKNSSSTYYGWNPALWLDFFSSSSVYYYHYYSCQLRLNSNRGGPIKSKKERKNKKANATGPKQGGSKYFRSGWVILGKKRIRWCRVMIRQFVSAKPTSGRWVHQASNYGIPSHWPLIWHELFMQHIYIYIYLCIVFLVFLIMIG